MTGTDTIDFGATPTDTATKLVTGLAGLTTSSHLEAWIQGGDTTGDNDVDAHRSLAISGRLRCEYVSDTSMNIVIDLMMGLATGTFLTHYATA
jgi:hypothetical protein